MKKFLITAAVCGVSFSCVESQARVAPNEEEKGDMPGRAGTLGDMDFQQVLEKMANALSNINFLEVVDKGSKSNNKITPLQKFALESKRNQLQGYGPLFLGDTVSGTMRGAMSSYHGGAVEDASRQFVQSGRQYLAWARMVSEDTENIETGTQLWDLYLSGAQAYRWAAHNASTDALRDQYIKKAQWALAKVQEVNNEESVTSKVSSEQEKLKALSGYHNLKKELDRGNQHLQQLVFSGNVSPLQRFARLAKYAGLQGYDRPFLGDSVSGSMRSALSSYQEGGVDSSQRFAQSGREYLNWAQMVSEDTENIETGTQLWDLYLSGAQAYRWAAHNSSTEVQRNHYIAKARWALDKTLEVSGENSVTSKVDSEREKLEILEG